jgi:hypothetical protein
MFWFQDLIVFHIFKQTKKQKKTKKRENREIAVLQNLRFLSCTKPD